MKRRMNNIFKKDGKCFCLAMDHSAQMYSPDLKDPGHVVRECVAGGVDAFLTTYGIIKNFSKDFGNAGIIMRADGGASMIRKPASPLELLYSAEDAIRVGADAMLCMGLPGSQTNEHSLKYLAKLAADCEKYNLPVCAEALPYGFERAEAVKGYLNIYFSSKIYSQRVIDEVLEKGNDYGKGEPTGQRVMVEFSQPNTHKAFHVGHLRNVILGNSVCNILEKSGDEVIRANYLGDIGLHVIKWMWCYLKYHNGEQPSGDITRWMGDIYAEASRRHETEPDADAEIRALFARWDRRDEDVVELWKTTRQWSLDGFDDIYNELGVHFDHLYFESEVEDSGKVIVDELIEKKIAVDERPEGAVVVKLDDLCGTKDKYRVLVVLRSDGTSLYATKDLSLAIKKFEQFILDRSIYVIDVRQSLYMQQIFKTMELMGYP